MDSKIDRHLAACVQQLPIRSIYRWQGEVHHDDEILLLVKTTRSRYLEVERAVLALHSYEVPAIICVEMATGSPSYLSWIDQQT